MIRVDIVGAEDLERALRGLSGQAARKAASESVAESMKPVVAKAKSLAPVETGTLKRSIGATVKIKRGRIIGRVGPLSGFGRIDSSGKFTPAGKYGNIVEFGHAKKGGGTVAAKPFLRPAFAATAQQCVAVLGADLGVRITAIVARKRRKHK